MLNSRIHRPKKWHRHTRTGEAQCAGMGGKVSFVQTVTLELKHLAHVEKAEEEEEENNSCIFRDITQCRAFSLLHTGFLLGVFFNPEVEEKCSTETSVYFQRSTRRYISKENSS